MTKVLYARLYGRFIETKSKITDPSIFTSVAPESLDW